MVNDMPTEGFKDEVTCCSQLSFEMHPKGKLNCWVERGKERWTCDKARIISAVGTGSGQYNSFHFSVCLHIFIDKR